MENEESLRIMLVGRWFFFPDPIEIIDAMSINKTAKYYYYLST